MFCVFPLNVCFSLGHKIRLLEFFQCVITTPRKTRQINKQKKSQMIMGNQGVTFDCTLEI